MAKKTKILESGKDYKHTDIDVSDWAEPNIKEYAAGPLKMKPVKRVDVTTETNDELFDVISSMLQNNELKTKLGIDTFLNKSLRKKIGYLLSDKTREEFNKAKAGSKKYWDIIKSKEVSDNLKKLQAFHNKNISDNYLYKQSDTPIDDKWQISEKELGNYLVKEDGKLGLQTLRLLYSYDFVPDMEYKRGFDDKGAIEKYNSNPSVGLIYKNGYVVGNGTIRIKAPEDYIPGQYSSKDSDVKGLPAVRVMKNKKGDFLYPVSAELLNRKGEAFRSGALLYNMTTGEFEFPNSEEHEFAKGDDGQFMTYTTMQPTGTYHYTFSPNDETNKFALSFTQDIEDAYKERQKQQPQLKYPSKSKNENGYAFGGFTSRGEQLSTLLGERRNYDYSRPFLDTNTVEGIDDLRQEVRDEVEAEKEKAKKIQEITDKLDSLKSKMSMKRQAEDEEVKRERRKKEMEEYERGEIEKYNKSFGDIDNKLDDDDRDFLRDRLDKYLGKGDSYINGIKSIISRNGFKLTKDMIMDNLDDGYVNAMSKYYALGGLVRLPKVKPTMNPKKALGFYEMLSEYK